MSKELKALEKICSQACKDRDLAFYLEHKNCKQTEENKKFFPYCDGCLYCSGNENYKIIEKALKEHEQYKAIEEKLGIDLVTFLKGVNPNTCFMEITKDKKFDFCGDAYYGTYTKEELLKLIENLLFMYWALTKES